MTDRAGVPIFMVAALFVVAACGGGASAQTTAATTTPVVATLPAASSVSAAPLPPASAPVSAPASAPASSATKTVAPSASTSASNDLIAEGKIVFTTIGPSGKGCQECHGANARGSTATDGTTSPSIVGTTEVKLRNALAGSAALMTNLKLTDRQIDAVLAYLAYLDNQ